MAKIPPCYDKEIIAHHTETGENIAAYHLKRGNDFYLRITCDDYPGVMDIHVSVLGCVGALLTDLHNICLTQSAQDPAPAAPPPVEAEGFRAGGIL